MTQLITYALCLLALTGLVPPKSSAADAVTCQLTVAQHPSEAEKQVLLVDTVDLVEGIPMTGYAAGFSSEIELTAIDSNKCGLTVHLVTLGPRANTQSRKFTVEYELPALISGIPTKDNQTLSFEIRPLLPATVDLQECPYNHRVDDQFKVRPSANADFHYVPGSFGDYYWPVVKALFEDEYRRVASMLKFSLPGKYTIYLSPCYMPTAWWDKRFATMVDPTRSSAMAVFGHVALGADPFVMINTAVQRNLGYSHPMLADGVSSFFAPSILDMREILHEDPSPMLETFANPTNYRTGDPKLVDRVASSFVKYLLASFGPGQFKRAYEAAHDLNLGEALEDVYGMSLPQIENEWRMYVDSVQMDLGTLSRYAQRAEALFDYDESLKQYGRMIERATSTKDSIRVLSELHHAYFFVGDYYEAANTALKLASLDSANAVAYMAAGSYQLMSGRFDPAGENLQQAKQIDSTDVLIDFNRGLYYHVQDRDQRAREALQAVVTESAGSGAQAESRILLGTILIASDESADQEQAKGYFRAAQGIINTILQAEPSRADLYLWNGISYAGTDELEAAQEYLQIAYFLETRPYYLGMVNLWLGKVADLKGDRAMAKEYYSQVLNLPSAAYHEAEARQLIETPFSWQTKL